MDKFRQFGDWHIRKPDGSALNLNTGEAAEWVLSLIARVEALEAQARKRGTQRTRKKADDDGDE